MRRKMVVRRTVMGRRENREGDMDLGRTRLLIFWKRVCGWINSLLTTILYPRCSSECIIVT